MLWRYQNCKNADGGMDPLNIFVATKSCYIDLDGDWLIGQVSTHANEATF